MIHGLRLLEKPDPAALRLCVRGEPKAHLVAVAERIACAVALREDDAVTVIGSLLAIDFPSRDAACAWLADEAFQRGRHRAESVPPQLSARPRPA